MSKNKRVRIFAGPNGSGKSSAYLEFAKKYDPGIYINADEIEKILTTQRLIDLTELGLEIQPATFEIFQRLPHVSSLMQKAALENQPIDIFLKANCLVNPNHSSNSYEAAFVGQLLRHLCVKSGKSFTFETVFSHASKIDEIAAIKKQGFKTYLYFVCTDDVEINKQRVLIRTKKGGHPVPNERIESRYLSSLEALEHALNLVDTIYFIDNSKSLEVVAIKRNSQLELLEHTAPQWFHTHVLRHFME